MDWKQVTSDAQGGNMLPEMNMKTKSQEQLFFKRVMVRYCSLFCCQDSCYIILTKNNMRNSLLQDLGYISGTKLHILLTQFIMWLTS